MRNLLKSYAWLLLAAIGASPAWGQDPRSSYNVTTDFSYTSEYVFRGIKQTDDAFQPSVEASFQNGYLGVWTSQPIKRHEDNEIDVYGGYKYKLSPYLSAEAVATYYWYPEAKGASTKHSFEAGVGGTYTVRGVATSLYYYRDFKLQSDTLQLSLGYSFPLEAIGASIDVSLIGGAVVARDWLPWSAGRVHESYNYYGVDVALPYKLSERATFTVGGHWAHNDGLPSVYDNSHLWWTVGLTVGF